MPPFKMAGSDLDEWSSFTGTPTDSLASTSYESTLCERSEPDQTFSPSSEDFVSTTTQKITCCFPASSKVSFDEVPWCMEKGNRLLESSQTIQKLSYLRPPLRWKDSHMESLLLKALRLEPTKGKEETSSSQETNSVSLAKHDHIFSYHKLSKQEFSLSCDADEEDQPICKDLQAANGSYVQRECVTSRDTIGTVHEQSQATPGQNFDGYQAARGLSHLSVEELGVLKEEMSIYVQEYSDILVEELTHREEQIREKDMKNKFISTLLAVQSRIRSLQQGKARKNTASALTGKYLTTVIPYREEIGGLSTSILERIIELMEAMLAESPTVANLLTDYILKVLCAEDD